MFIFQIFIYLFQLRSSDDFHRPGLVVRVSQRVLRGKALLRHVEVTHCLLFDHVVIDFWLNPFDSVIFFDSLKTSRFLETSFFGVLSFLLKWVESNFAQFNIEKVL